MDLRVDVGGRSGRLSEVSVVGIGVTWSCPLLQGSVSWSGNHLCTVSVAMLVLVRASWGSCVHRTESHYASAAALQILRDLRFDPVYKL